MYKILLVEDEMMLRAGLKNLIENVIGDFVVTGEAGNGLEALEELRRSLPDLIMTDIRMKRMDGLELIRNVRNQYPVLPILIISGHDDFEYVKSALQYRVSDYLLKPINRVELAQYLTGLKKQLDGRREPRFNHRDLPGNKDENGHTKQIIRKVKELINERLDQRLSLQYVANQVHLNSKYLSNLFKAETGKNFIDYVTECLMEQAKQLLKETNLKIYEIANLSGYPNAKHFMTMFKQYAGITASDYREQYSGEPCGKEKDLDSPNHTCT